MSSTALCIAAITAAGSGSVTSPMPQRMMRLAASISLDRRSKPQKLGYNADRSDRMGQYWRGGRHYFHGVTVNGEEP